MYLLLKTGHVLFFKRLLTIEIHYEFLYRVQKSKYNIRKNTNIRGEGEGVSKFLTTVDEGISLVLVFVAEGTIGIEFVEKSVPFFLLVVVQVFDYSLSTFFLFR